MQDTAKYWPFILAAIALISALISYARDRRFARRAMTAVGGVVDWKSERTRQGEIHFPEIEFRTADGQAVRFVSRFGSTEITTTRPVSVLYDPAKPADAEVKQEIKSDKRATLFLVAAAFLVAFGVANWP
jgi:hypothetical protein